MKTLLCKCRGPLQAWGNDSNYDTRRTAHMPTKSAFIGLLAAALGLPRDADSEIRPLNDLHFACRIDQQGSLLMDYHTAHQKKVKTQNGSPALVDGSVYVTNRYYLQDAVFLVAIGGKDEALMDRLEEALKKPFFSLFLGRRSVPVPADFFMGSKSLDPITALKELPWQAADWYKKRCQKEKIRLEIYADADLVKSPYRSMEKEYVLSFSQKNRQFSNRAIGRTIVEKENPCFSQMKNQGHPQGEEPSWRKEHDIFKAIGG